MQRTGEHRPVVGALHQCHAEPAVTGKGMADHRQCFVQIVIAWHRRVAAGGARTVDVRHAGVGHACVRHDRVRGRQHDRQALCQPVCQIGEQQAVAALGGAPAGEADQLRQVAIAVAGAGQQDDPLDLFAVVDDELRTDDQRQPAFLRRQMGAHHPGHRTFVGDRQCAVAQGRCLGDQFLGMRRTAQETEVGKRVEFRAGGQHGSAAQSGASPHENTPCRYQREGSTGSR